MDVKLFGINAALIHSLHLAYGDICIIIDSRRTMEELFTLSIMILKKKKYLSKLFSTKRTLKGKIVFFSRLFHCKNFNEMYQIGHVKSK